MTPAQLLEISRRFHIISNSVDVAWDQVPVAMQKTRAELAGVTGQLRISVSAEAAVIDEDLLKEALVAFANDECEFYPSWRGAAVEVQWTVDLSDDRAVATLRVNSAEARHVR